MKVAICTPCRSGSVHHDHMMSRINVVSSPQREKMTIFNMIGAGCSIITRARNQLVAIALDNGADWIVFVDDDIGFDAKDFFKLIGHDVDVVGGAPARRHKRWDDKPALLGRPKEGSTVREYVTPAGRLWEVDRMATAFIAIRAPVFKAIEPFTEAYHSGGTMAGTGMRSWFWFDLDEVDGKLHDEGEDYNFCRKWTRAGGKCFLDPDIRLRHYEGNVCHDYCPADMEIERRQIAAE